mgnify:CR=1 FL=1|jgi:hypothetical protein|tara:strand:+ start:463 stop:675 length:213 start_codon:yes stop_codon:yes gene_type:complete
MSNKKIQVADWYDKHWDHWLNTKEKISPKEIDGLFPKEFKQELHKEYLKDTYPTKGLAKLKKKNYKGFIA